MTGAAVAWLPGHGSRPGGWDPGALSPAGWSEADLVRDVAAAAWRECERLRVPSEIVAAGSYLERGQDAEAGAGAAFIVQLHADASSARVGPDVARVFYWPDNEAGRELAHQLADALEGVVPWPVAVCAAVETWPGPRACPAAVRPTSLVVELGFTDGQRGRVQLPSLAEQIGRALARACAA